jgi:predicted GNAT family acetyltransferase
MAALQAAYEQEEVVPRGSTFSPAASRVNIANIIVNGQTLAAELDGRLVGKINISAVSFTRYQVGGVYVHPDFRGLGIARRMATEFIGPLVAQGRGVTLFVKKSNLAARRLYSGLGFSVRGDYRISYY